jgi:predicted GIY-YIG superfamily endonuclease
MEQRKILLEAKNLIQHYSDPTTTHKNLVIVGSPGTGKTTVCEIITLYALCKGLNGVPTSLVAERAKQLGGTHIHELFSLRGSDRITQPGLLAERAVYELYKKPHLLSFLRRLDFLFFDELGLLNAELLAVLDLVFRYVRRTGEYMGGLFILCTIDILQLLPWKGSPALLSMNTITDFIYMSLQESVRAASDPDLQEINNLTRTDIWTEIEKKKLADLLDKSCTFVDAFDDLRIPHDAVFVFGRRAPCEEAERIMLNRMRRIHNDFVVSFSFDEESSIAGNWHPASVPAKTILSRKVKQRSKLSLYPGARYEFAYNIKNKFSQGQLAILLHVPHQESVQRHEAIIVWAAPPGCKEYPLATDCTEAQLIVLGWYKSSVPYTTSESQSIHRGILGRRTQYGLKPRVASTIHACMGSTLPAIVTAVVPIANSNLDFGLWEAAQVVVLLSRTRRASHIFFVGDRQSTIQHLIDKLGMVHRHLPYIKKLLKSLCGERIETPVLIHPTIYRPCDAVIGHTGCVYLLVSTKQIGLTYIGSTSDMARRLDKHNTGQGGAGTCSPLLRPWAIMMYISGLPSKQERLRFEAVWKVTAQRYHIVRTDVEELIAVAHNLAQKEKEAKGYLLRIVRCGSIVISANS